MLLSTLETGAGDLLEETDEKVLSDLAEQVAQAAARLGEGSPWLATMAVLTEELREGQPFFFKFALASSSRSISETPVAVE
jgi:hypothetical protein